MTEETIEDILREMRSGKLSATVECENCGNEYEQRFSFDTLANRIEAAYKRERETVTGCNQLGNAAAMREALEEIRVDAMSDYEPDADYLIVKCNAALFAPARNCDLPNTDKRYEEFCNSQKSCSICPANKFGALRCDGNWLLAKASMVGMREETDEQ